MIMKRARVLLTIIVIFAIVAGALAFKAHRGVTIFYRSTANGTGACTATLVNYTMVVTVSATVYCTTVPNAPCSVRCTFRVSI